MPNQRKSPIKFEGEAVDPALQEKKEDAARPPPPPPPSEGQSEGTADENIGGVQRPPADS
ncbi:MAG TPA: hypothetical protein VER33_12045 [Polyangiaceae bacterium]|nr:hypothetical protein [Polyangiaceae bacterium]